MNIKSVVLGEITKQVEASIPELQKGLEANLGIVRALN